MEFLDKDDEEEFLNTLASLETSVRGVASPDSIESASGRNSPPLVGTSVWNQDDRLTPSPSTIGITEEEILDFDFLDKIMLELDDSAPISPEDSFLRGTNGGNGSIYEDALEKYVDFFSLSGEADRKQKQLQTNLRYQEALMNFKLKLDETVRENQELHKNLAGILSKTINQTVHKKSSFSPSASSLKRTQQQRWIQRRFPPNIKFDSSDEEWSRLLPPEFLSSTDHTPEGMQIAIKHLKLNWLWTKFGDDIGYHQTWSPQDRNQALKAITVFVRAILSSVFCSTFLIVDDFLEARGDFRGEHGSSLVVETGVFTKEGTIVLDFGVIGLIDSTCGEGKKWLFSFSPPLSSFTRSAYRRVFNEFS